MSTERVPGAPPPEQQLGSEVARRVQRRRRAEREARRSIWFSLGLFGIVGWSIAVPALIGIAAGLWLDARFGGRLSWTLTLLAAGIALGCLNAWRWIKQETREEPPDETDEVDHDAGA